MVKCLDEAWFQLTERLQIASWRVGYAAYIVWILKIIDRVIWRWHSTIKYVYARYGVYL